jgi:glycosyltransferase involved in cell wall biosynthesis
MQPTTAVVRQPGQHTLPISVAIITLNEEQNLARCLESLRGLVEEIVVLDSGSTDGTHGLARRFGATVEVHPWEGFGPQKNAAMQRCRQPWILCLDADEALSPELADAVRAIFANGDPPLDAYWLNRRTFYLGRWIWHAWYPEWRLRLVRRGRGEWRGLEPHPELCCAGNTGKLRGDLLHYPFHNLQQHLQRWIQYAHIMADLYERQGKRCHWYHLIGSPSWAFFRVLVLRRGFLDGWRGWVIAFATQMYVFAKYAFLWEKQSAHANREH